MDGILNIYKEKGWTSFDVVAKLRRILKVKKIGHTGTLDPDAEGVLPVCVGHATKAVEALMDHDKEYRAVLLFGKKTDTGDLSGKILAEAKVPPLTEKEIVNVLSTFVPGYAQIPPMYSALKVNGKRLYEYAREGVVIEREPREVQIPLLRLDSMALPRITITTVCGRGTYIRALCEDIGEKLDLPACMESLLRTRVGDFFISDAKKIAEIEEAAQNGTPERCFSPVEWDVIRKR